MQFNPDFNKKTQELIFSRKILKSKHSAIYFNDPPGICVDT